jgi:hypothetical protein
VDMLVRRGEAIRLAAIALDDRRRFRLLAVTGSRVADATVIAKAQWSVSTMSTPDIGLAVRLALESLIVRNSLAEAGAAVSSHGRKARPPGWALMTDGATALRPFHHHRLVMERYMLLAHGNRIHVVVNH